MPLAHTPTHTPTRATTPTHTCAYTCAYTCPHTRPHTIRESCIEYPTELLGYYLHDSLYRKLCTITGHTCTTMMHCIPPPLYAPLSTRHATLSQNLAPTIQINSYTHLTLSHPPGTAIATRTYAHVHAHAAVSYTGLLAYRLQTNVNKLLTIS